ncbi:MAG TPA: hypothetical protein VMH37_04005 [Candidatus Binataceae bacterium]|nr:hypothetical protein [Candidatus Binataceae bacterium]
MKHAGPDALDRIEPLLARVRRLEGLKEPKRGTFYRGSSAFLHFHEDPAGMFADIKLDGDFQRFRVSTRKEIDTFLACAARALKS